MGSKPEFSLEKHMDDKHAASLNKHDCPVDPVYFNSLGLVLKEQGKPDEAFSCFQKAVEIDPDYVEAYNHIGNALREQGKSEEALMYYKKALGINPNSAVTYFNMGITLRGQGKPDEAIFCYRKVLEINPASANVYFNMGNVLKDHNKTEEAISCYRKVLEINPKDADAYSNMGIAYKNQDNIEEAISCYKKALEINPESAEAYCCLADAYKDRNNLKEAISYYQKALHLNPEFPKAYIGIGGVYYQRDRLSEAISCCETALLFDPEYVEAYYNLGMIMDAVGQTEDAIKKYNHALQFDPEHRDASWNRSLALLLLGDFEEGWKGYEQRIHENEWKHVYPYRYGLPRWDGSSLAGKKLFIHEEQGIGDTLQFIRYLPMAKARGGTVVFETRPHIFSLLDNFEGIDMLVERSPDGKPVVECDCYIPLLSLPGIFETALDTIPSNVPYLFSKPAKAKYWRDRLAGPGFKVGIVWAGNPSHKKDASRSCPLKYFSTLANIPGVSLYGLQKGVAAADIEISSEGRFLKNVGAELKDFNDTAGLIENLDLVISVDTAVAHLAGAMGKPIWTLLPFVPDWRWMLGREDSPWYPTMRLFRQSNRGDWIPVLTRVENELRILTKQETLS